MKGERRGELNSNMNGERSRKNKSERYVKKNEKDLYGCSKISHRVKVYAIC